MAEPEEINLSGPRCAVRERQVAALQARAAQLERSLLEALRASIRQAAPFSQKKAQETSQEAQSF